MKETLQLIPQKIQRILRANKLENIENMDKYLETYNLPKLNWEEIENLNRSTSSKKIELVIAHTQKIQHRELQNQMISPVNSAKTFKKNQCLSFSTSSKKIKEERKLSKSFYGASIILSSMSGKIRKKKNYR